MVKVIDACCYAQGLGHVMQGGRLIPLQIFVNLGDNNSFFVLFEVVCFVKFCILVAIQNESVDKGGVCHRIYYYSIF